MSKRKFISRLVFSLQSGTLFKDFFRMLFSSKQIVDDAIAFQKKRARQIMNYNFNFETPRSFNEHLVWLLLNYQNPLWERRADKLKMKEFLIENGFGNYVVKTIGKPYNSSSEIVLDDLPEEFVLKTNHDSGSVFVCKKGVTDFGKVFRELDKSLLRNYCDTGGEWVYKNIKPLIFAEELIKPALSKELIDYKFFCFNGTFGWGFTAQNRSVDTRFMVFENDFSIQKVSYIYRRPNKKEMPPKPIHYNQMVDAAKRISKILDFVRVDFYESTDGPKIGELTFFSQCGTGVFSNKKYDFKYGKFFEYTKVFGISKK